MPDPRSAGRRRAQRGHEAFLGVGRQGRDGAPQRRWVLETLESPHVQFIDRVVDVPVSPLSRDIRTRCWCLTRSSSGRESPSRTLTSSVPRFDAQVAMQSSTTREHKHTQIDAGSELKNASEILRMEQKDWIGETK